MKAGTRVRICAYAGRTFEPDWSQTGRIVRTRQPMPGPDWHLVQFDAGGRLCVHRERLMVCNDQAA